MQKIRPFLWFDGRIEEAVSFYTAVFSHSTVLGSMPGPDGKLMTATLDIDGQELILFNGGPQFKLNEAFSLMVSCETQEEIDHYWAQLIKGGGQESRCGWLKDQFGLSWQVVPPVLLKLLSDPDREKAGRAMQAMLQMNKIIIVDLQKAFEGN